MSDDLPWFKIHTYSNDGHSFYKGHQDGHRMEQNGYFIPVEEALELWEGRTMSCQFCNDASEKIAKLKKALEDIIEGHQKYGLKFKTAFSIAHNALKERENG